MAGDISGESFLAGLQKVLGPFIIKALGYTLDTAQLRDAFCSAQVAQYNPDLPLSALYCLRVFHLMSLRMRSLAVCLTFHSSLHEDEDVRKVSISPDLNLCHGL